MRIVQRYSETPPPITDDATVVTQNSWRRSEGGILTTQEAQTCPVAVVFNSAENRGYMGHFEAYGLEFFDEFIQSVIKKEIDQKVERPNLDIWAGGATKLKNAAVLEEPGAIKSALEFFNEDILVRRGYIAERLGELTTAEDLKTGWLGVDQQLAQVTLDCRTGLLEIYRDDL